jgi:threonine dehydratase
MDHLHDLIQHSYSRIREHLVMTPLIKDVEDIFLKCENLQTTGSFKWRGALSKLSTLPPGSSIVTASTGNHGLAVVQAAKFFNLQVTVFIPGSAVEQKRKKLKEAGATLRLVDGDSLDAEITGKQMAQTEKIPWVSPYNDELVIAGQGTLGLELSQQISAIDKVYITVGGGGLISGVASWLHHYHPEVEIIGCQPIHSPEMYLSVLSGHVVEAPDSLPTLSDGSSGPLETDSITFPLCQQLVDRFILVGEEEIKSAIRHVHKHHSMIIEGAAGVAMAAALKDELRKTGEQNVVILCGGNIDPLLANGIINEVVSDQRSL